MIFNRVSFLFVFLLFIPTVMYLPNPGGVGIALPFNLLFCGGAALIMAVWWGLAIEGHTVITPICRTLLAASLLLILPVGFTHPEWQSGALWRLAGLFTGVLFYFTWLQVRMTTRQRHAVLYVILIATAVQALIVLLQLFAPQLVQCWVPVNSGRAVGIFQQPNVTASFIAIGMALALAAFILPGFHIANLNAERWRRRALALALVLLPMVLVWLQSRTGWLAGILVSGAFILCFYRRCSRRASIASFLMIGGTLTAVLVLWWGDLPGGNIRYISHAGSNHARISMLNDTLAMIAEKPFAGWGYGGFEYSFQHFRLAHGLSTEAVGISRHPHNELLLWWVEGGLVALSGMVLLIIGGLKLMIRACYSDVWAFVLGKATAGEAMALCIAMLPILLHTQTEYPFYLSTLHWLVFLMLLAMLDRLVSQRLGVLTPGPVFTRFRLPMLTLSLLAFFAASTGLYSGLVLTQAEKKGLQDMHQVESLPVWMSWMHTERLQFDRQLSALQRFNATRDEQLLETYTQWAQSYLNQRIDKNVYANLVMILRFQQQDVLAEQYQREAAGLFPMDERFIAAIKNRDG